MSDRLKWLAQQFDSLVEKINASPGPERKNGDTSTNEDFDRRN